MLHGERGLDELFEHQSIFDEDNSEDANYIKQKISVARGSLILDQPFFGYILGHFKITPVNTGINTFAADTNHLYFNTTYLLDLIKYNSDWKGKIKGILIHLLIHIIFRHHKRQQEKIPQIWGYATDIVVFSHLREIQRDWMAPGDWDLPDIRTIPEELLGHSADKTYQLLIDQFQEEMENQQGRGAGDDDEEEELREDPNLEEFSMEFRDEVEEMIGIKGNECNIEEIVLEASESTDIEELEEQYFEGMLRTAYERQKGFGSLPEGLDRFISKQLHPKVDWKAKLAGFLQKVLVHDLTWTRPNKRLYGQGYYFPGPLKENTEVLLGLDTSGSITDEILQTFLSEAQAMLETITNVKLIVADCDAEIQQITEYEAGETIQTHNFKGKGGTDFRPVFELTNEYQPDVIVYITDGYGRFPEETPIIPTIWVLTTDEKPPFGEIIRIES